MRASIACVLCLALAGIGVAPVLAADGIGPSCAGLSPGPRRAVVRIIDGETVALDDGSALRLIGALAPRALDVGAQPGTWDAERRTREALTTFLLGRSIELAFGGERLDRYGRLQAHAFRLGGSQPQWVQGYLLQEGLARFYAVAGNRACATELLAAERVAREARRGVWAEAAYQVRTSELARELLSYRTTFQVVEGRIARVAQVRGVIYLNFNRNWRQAFSASVRAADPTVLEGVAGNPKGLEGRRVRVRGWIEGDSRPSIDLSTSGQIEVLDEASSPAAR